MTTRKLSGTRPEFHVVSTLPEAGEASPELSALTSRSTLIGFETKAPRVVRLGPPFVEAPPADDARTAFYSVQDLLGRRAAELIDAAGAAAAAAAAATKPQTVLDTPAVSAGEANPRANARPLAALTPLRIAMLLLAVMAALLLIGKPVLKSALASARAGKTAPSASTALRPVPVSAPQKPGFERAAGDALASAAASGPAPGREVRALRADAAPALPAGLSLARVAADRLAQGDLEGALSLYERLASLEPEHDAYREARDILARRLSRAAH